MSFGRPSLGAPVASAPATSAADPRDLVRILMRFSAWAHELEAFPSIADVVEEFDCSEATAVRWLDALAAAYDTTREEQEALRAA